MNMPDEAMQLPQIVECNGCGVCCLHMGYPAFMLPMQPANENVLQSDKCKALLTAGWTREELLAGHPGESYWHKLPDDLKSAWKLGVKEYKEQMDTSDSHADNNLDGPCFWFDMQTRKCEHHEFRPQVCRDFETGSELCHEWRTHYRELIVERVDPAET